MRHTREAPAGWRDVKPFEMRVTIRQLLDEADPPAVVFTVPVELNDFTFTRSQMASVPSEELWARLQQAFPVLPAEAVLTMDVGPTLSNRVLDFRSAGEA